MIITAIEPQKRNTDRVNIHVDGEFRCGAAREAVRAHGLHAGDEVTPAALAALERDDARFKARDAALRLLGHRARSAAELRDRLRRKGYAAELIDDCIAELRQKGYVDDAAFAESFVRDRVRLRPKGRRRLLQELRGKGVDEAAARSAVDEVFGAASLSESALALRAARAWARRHVGGRAGAPEREARLGLRRRLYAHLQRRGFDGDAIRQAMADVLDDE